MFDSAIVDVAVGLSLVYLMLSLMSSTLSEWIAQIVDRRGKGLEAAIRQLLAEPVAPQANGTEKADIAAAGGSMASAQLRRGEAALADLVLTHPLIAGLAPGKSRPSYIPARAFVAAIFDVIAPASPGQGGQRDLAQARAAIAEWPEGVLRTKLLALIDTSQGSLDGARLRLEQWFDDSMDRVSGGYKRNTRWVLLAIGVGLAALLNADTITLAQRLQHDGALRRAVAQAAATVDKEGGTIRIDHAQLAQLDLLFWDGVSRAGVMENPRALRVPEASIGWIGWLLRKLLGFSLTALAVSLGAPFWFDLLNRFGSARSTGKVPERAA